MAKAALDGAPISGNDALAWARWGAATGMLGVVAYLVGTGLIPPTARLEAGAIELARILAAMPGRLYFAAFMAIAGAILIVVLFVALTLLVPAGRPGSGLLRVSLATSIIAHTLVPVGGIVALVAVNAAASGMNPEFVLLCWRALWLSFVASAVPTVLYTATAVLGLARAGLAPGWISILGWIAAIAHAVALFAVRERGLFALDGLVGMLTPLTTDLWLLALCVTLPGRVRRQV